MTSTLLIIFYLLAGLAALAVLGIMILHTMAEHDARTKQQAKRPAADPAAGKKKQGEVRLVADEEEKKNADKPS